MSKYGTPFGAAGLRPLLGLENDAHYGFNSGIFDFGCGKWTVVYRRASNHTVVNGAEVRAFDTYDQGQTQVNDRLIYTSASCDTRNFVGRKMAGGRLGIIASCRTAALAYLPPVFLYSDDDGVTWTAQTITPPASGWAVNFHGHMIDYPSSVGGEDDGGFIAHSYGHTGGHIDACYTLDNGSTWFWRTQVASPPVGIAALSEMACARVGDQDKWIMLVRPTGAMDAPGLSFVSSDPLAMGSGVNVGLGLAGNPPQVIYDDTTNLFWYTSFARRDRGWKRNESIGSKGRENVFLVVSADADALYAASGSMTALGNEWEIAAYLPDWGTGYLHPTKIDGAWFGTFVCGEQYPDHCYSKLCLIGDFIPSGLDNMNMAWMMQWSGVAERATFREHIDVGFGTTKYLAERFLNVAVEAATPGMRLETFSNSYRDMIEFANNSGLAGSISAVGSTVSYNT